MDETLAFLRLVTGRGTWPVLQVLLDGEATAADIALRLMRTTGAVRHQLRRLEKVGAVGHHGGRPRVYWINVNVTWWVNHTRGVVRGLAGDLGPSLPFERRAAA